jgi:ribonucleotide monophosphatase NagD (HAD superfamily)
MAQRSGLLGVLVLSGETSRERLEGQEAVRPDLVLRDVEQLYKLLRAGRSDS